MDSLIGKSTLDPTKSGSKSLFFFPSENIRSALSFSVYEALYQDLHSKSNL